MEETFEYNIYKHKQTNICWLLINIVLTVAYFIEITKGLRDLPYVIVFMIVTWLPYAIFNICRCITDISDIALEYIAGIGYLLFYVFAMITSQTVMVFCYIFPMLTILTVYSNRVLNSVVMSIVTIINILMIVLRVMTTDAISGYDITDYEIQMACILLCTLFLWRSSKVLILRDNMIETLANDAYYDMLTKIHNRMYLIKLKKFYKTDNKHVKSLAIIDIDDFKQINDKFGHQSGDDALVKVAELLISVTKTLPGTIPIRLGGDEFIIISSGVEAEDLQRACTRLKQKLLTDKVYASNNKVIPITVSIGIIQGYEGADFESLYEPCDKLLYDAKEAGKDVIKVKTTAD